MCNHWHVVRVVIGDEHYYKCQGCKHLFIDEKCTKPLKIGIEEILDEEEMSEVRKANVSV